MSHPPVAQAGHMPTAEALGASGPSAAAAVRAALPAAAMGFISFFLVTSTAAFAPTSATLMALIYAFDVALVMHYFYRFYRYWRQRQAAVAPVPPPGNTAGREKSGQSTIPHTNRWQWPLLLDIVSLVPLEFTALLFAPYSLQSILAANLRLNRVLRLHSGWSLLQQKATSITDSGATILVAKSIFSLVLCLHLASCLWNGLAGAAVKTTWTLPAAKTDVNSSLTPSFDLASYWSVATLTSTGYGDVRPITAVEKWLALIVMLLGVLLWGYVFGGATSFFTNNQQQAYKTSRVVRQLRHHMQLHQLDPDLTEKVLARLTSNGRQYEAYTGDGGLMSALPSLLLDDVRSQTWGRMLQQVPCISNVCSQEACRALIEAASLRHHIPGEVLMHRGQLLHDIVIIVRGDIHALDQASQLLDTLVEGECFGEPGTLLELRSVVELRAATHLDVLVMQQTMLRKVLSRFPGTWEALKAFVQARVSAAEEEVQYEGELAAGDQLRRAPAAGRRTVIFINEDKPAAADAADVAEEKPSRSQRVQQFFLHKTVRCSLALLAALMALYIFAYGMREPAAWWLASVIDVPFYCQFVALLVKRSELLVQQPKLALWYLVLLPWELVGLLGNKNFFLAAVLHLNRLCRLLDLWWAMQNLTDNIRVARPQLIRLSVLTLLSVHLLTCICHLLACPPLPDGAYHCRANSWLSNHGASNASGSRRYVAALYWTLASMTSTGYGDIAARTTGERLFSIIVMLSGKILFGFLMATLGAALSNRDSEQTAYHELLTDAKRFLEEHKIEASLHVSTIEHLRRRWQLDQGHIPWQAYRGLPQSLRHEVLPKLVQRSLGVCPVFAELSAASASLLAVRLRSCLALRGTTVMNYGDLSRSVYFIEAGHVELRREDGRAFLRLGPGAYFGELDAVFQRRRHHSAHTLTDCRLLTLSWQDIQAAMAISSTFACRIQTLTAGDSIVEAAQQAMAEMPPLPPMVGDRSLVGRRRRRRGQMATFGFRNRAAISVESKTTTASDGSVTPSRRAHNRPSAHQPEAQQAAPGSRLENLSTSMAAARGQPLARSPTQSSKHYRSEASAASSSLSSQIPSSQTRSEFSSHSEYSPGTSLAAHRLSRRKKLAQPQGAFGRLLAKLKQYYRRFLHRLSFWTPLLYTVLAVVQSFLTLFITAFASTAPLGLTLFYVLELCLVPLSVYALGLQRWESSTGAMILWRAQRQKAALSAGHWRSIVAAFPLEAFLVVGAGTDSRITALGRLTRLFRLPLVWQEFSRLEQRAELTTPTIRMIKYAIFYALAWVAVAATWSLLACFDQCNSSSWVAGENDTHLWSRFFASLYWAVATMLSVGYGDIYARTGLEQAFSGLIMLLGTMVMGYVTASVTGALANADFKRTRFQEKVSAVGKLLGRLRQPDSVLDRVQRLFLHLWQRSRGTDFSACTAGLPPSLQTELAYSIYSEAIDRVPLFAGKEMAFRRMLATAMQPLQMLAGEFIVRKNEEGEHMYFIHKGSVEVVSEDGQTVFATMSDGAFFGEIALVFRCPRTATIRTTSPCDLFVLSQEDFNAVLFSFPEVAEEIRAEAQERFQLVKKREGTKSQIRPLATKRPAASPQRTKTVVVGKKCKRFNSSKAPAEDIPTLVEVTRWHWLVAQLQYNRPIGVCSAALLSGWMAVYMVSFARNNVGAATTALLVELLYISTNLPNIQRSWWEWVALAPWDIMTLAIRHQPVACSVAAVFRLSRLWRLRLVQRGFDLWESRRADHLVRIRLAKLLLLVVSMIHGLAAVWHLVECRQTDGCNNSAWPRAGSVTDDYDAAFRYTTSVYLTVATVTSTGYGDFHADTVAGRLVAVLAMILGFIVFTYLLASISSTMANNNYMLVEYRQRCQQVLSAIGLWHESAALRRTVDRHLQSQWWRSNGRRDQDILCEIPEPLRNEIMQDLWRPAVCDLLGSGASEGALAATVRALHLCTALKDDIILHQGDVVNRLILVQDGIIEALYAPRSLDGVQCKNYGPGSWLELAAFKGQQMASADYKVASSQATLLLLTDEAVLQEVQRHPELAAVFPWAQAKVPAAAKAAQGHHLTATE